MLDPRTILIAIPCYDGKLMAETAGVLMSCQGRFAALHTPSECSHVSLVRNLIAGQFLASPYEWLVCIDSDISFLPQDLEYLLEPCDLSVDYAQDLEVALDQDPRFSHGNAPPRPTRAVIAQSVDLKRLDMKAAAASDVLVCAEYSYKDDKLEPVHLGLGFTRIHRSVFETLENLKHEKGPLVEVSREIIGEFTKLDLPPDRHGGLTYQELMNYAGDITRWSKRLMESIQDPAGSARLWQCSHQGRRYTDFYPSGPILSQFVPTAQWKGEDHGFFTLCMLAGIIPRIETRTRLTHIGRKGYPYLGPDQGGGQ